MNTLGFGDHVITASTIEEGLATAQAMDRLKEASDRRQYLQDCNHGHQFVLNQQCECGMLRMDYVLQRTDNSAPLCPIFDAKLVDPIKRRGAIAWAAEAVAATKRQREQHDQ